MPRRALAVAGTVIVLLGIGTTESAAGVRPGRGVGTWSGAHVSLPASAGHGHADALGAEPVTTSGISQPWDITAGPDGALWFTNFDNNTIGRITTSGTITSYTGPGISEPYWITAGPDGALWFTNYLGGSIGRITTDGQVSNYTDPSITSPQGITAGPDGALWFTNRTNGVNNGSIGAITTSGTITNYTDPSINAPEWITAGPDGALWFTNYVSASIGRITTSGTVSNYTGTGIDHPAGITAGPDGALWFTNIGGSTIGRITTSGTITNYTDPSLYDPWDITAGPDGALWFTNRSENSIGRITTSGTITTYTHATISSPHGITAGPDGALWFTNNGNNTIGRITTSGTFTFYGGLASAATLAATPNPSSYGQSVTLTATVSPTDGGGTVAFSADGKLIPGCSTQPLSLVGGSSYQATCATSALAVGSHVVEATYSGDAGYAASAATLQQTVNKTPTTTGVSSSVNPSRYGQSVIFTATITSADGAGTVTFWYAGNTIAGCTSEPLQQSAGSYKASCTTSSLPVGTDKIKAVYSGDKNCFGSAGTLSQVVNRIPTATKLKSFPNPSTFGQTVKLTATISPADGGGTVTFSVNGHPISGCSSKTLTWTGSSYQAVCKTSALPRGTDTVKAAYSGDTKYKASSGTVTQQVN